MSGDANARRPPMIPTERLLPREVDLLDTPLGGLGRTSAKIFPLAGGDGALVDSERPRQPGTEVALIGELDDDHESCCKVGEVFKRGNDGFAGTGRGLTNLSVGSMVRCSELMELVLSLRVRPVRLSAKGTLSTLTSWPGSIGQVAVEGSAELWNSISSSRVYCRSKSAKKSSRPPNVLT
jgi:hypothetical protein